MTLEEQLADDELGYLTDLDHGPAPVLIAFGGIGGQVGISPFEFFRLMSSVPVNKIFIRDIDQSFYHRGIRGLGTTFEQCGDALAALVPLDARRVVCIGSSAGGFAASVFGTMIGADQVIAIAPITYLTRVRRRLTHDRRWRKSIDPINRGPGRQRAYLDLRRFLRSQSGPLPRTDVYYAEKHRLDALHARRLRGIRNVHLLPRTGANHALAKEMRDSGELERMFSEALHPESVT
jgi:hypothetical protein